MSIFEELEKKNINGTFVSNRTVSEICFIQGEKKSEKRMTILLLYPNKDHTLFLDEKMAKLENNNASFSIFDGKYFLFLEFDSNYTRIGKFVLSKNLPKN